MFSMSCLKPRSYSTPTLEPPSGVTVLYAAGPDQSTWPASQESPPELEVKMLILARVRFVEPAARASWVSTTVPSGNAVTPPLHTGSGNEMMSRSAVKVAPPLA